MARLIYSPRALEDLERLVSFLEEAIPREAEKALDEILRALEIVTMHPLIGRRFQRGLRELVISRGKTGYLALYRFDPVHGVVRVLRIRHQREGGYLE